MPAVLEKYRLAYVAPNKTGSCTIVNWLARMGRVTGRQGGKRHMAEGLKHGYLLVVSVRDPYTRVPSAWANLHRKRKVDLNLEEWLRAEYGGKRRKWNGFSGARTTMVEHLRPVLHRIGFVVRLESIEQDLRRLADLIGAPWREPREWHRNRTPERYCRGELTEAERTLIRDKSVEDFEIIGYPMGN